MFILVERFLLMKLSSDSVRASAWEWRYLAAPSKREKYFCKARIMFWDVLLLGRQTYILNVAKKSSRPKPIFGLLVEQNIDLLAICQLFYNCIYYRYVNSFMYLYT